MLTNLDLLRSIAILVVLSAHWILTLSGNGPGERLVCGVDIHAFGRSGVLIFFVHTSLVLMKSLQRSGESGWRLFRAFYLRRIFRIYPLSIVLCVVMVVFAIPRNVMEPVYWWPGKIGLLGNLTLTLNILDVPSLSTPMWSLPYELQMYLLLPVIFLFLRVKRWALRFAVIFALGIAASRFWTLAVFVPDFLCGVLAFGLVRQVRPRWPAWIWPLLVLSSIAAFSTAARLHEDSFPVGLTLCLVLGTTMPLFRDATLRPLCLAASTLAKYSYGIYLCHFPLMWLFYRKLAALPTAERHFGFVVSIVLLPVLCFHLVEHPLIKIGNWLATQRGALNSSGFVVSKVKADGAL